MFIVLFLGAPSIARDLSEIKSSRDTENCNNYRCNIVLRTSGSYIYIYIYLSCRILTTEWSIHYSDVMMNTMESEITGVSIVYATVCSDVDQRKHASSASLAFMREFHWLQRASNAPNVSIWWRHWPWNMLHKFYQCSFRTHCTK